MKLNPRGLGLVFAASLVHFIPGVVLGIFPMAVLGCGSPALLLPGVPVMSQCVTSTPK